MTNKIEIQIDSKNQIIPKGIDLSDSFIMNWKLNGSNFEIQLELSIWPESPHYSKPLTNEFTCYKKGNIRFYGITEIIGFVELDSVKPNIDPDGSKDWECIYGLTKENEQYKFQTEFANIEIKCKGIEMGINE